MCMAVSADSIETKVDKEDSFIQENLRIPFQPLLGVGVVFGFVDMYIAGGVGAGLSNSLEPVVYGLCFGYIAGSAAGVYWIGKHKNRSWFISGHFGRKYIRRDDQRCHTVINGCTGDLVHSSFASTGWGNNRISTLNFINRE